MAKTQNFVCFTAVLLILILVSTDENVPWIRANLKNVMSVARQRLGNKFVENANKRALNYIVIVAAKHLIII
ncbi:unnamed protein product [Arabidopsis thaliana]|uniref:Transmembrane protein n=1 Tax=Arabidopsis thaliana TaxID=3702 RepID=A0A5S9XRA2_ARATH|nr:unnamed protein product [Arabidopsis thaliana]